MAEVERPVHSSFSDLQGAESRACGKSTSTYYHVCFEAIIHSGWDVPRL